MNGTNGDVVFSDKLSSRVLGTLQTLNASLLEMRDSVSRISAATQSQGSEPHDASEDRPGSSTDAQSRAGSDAVRELPEDVARLLGELVSNPAVRSAIDPSLVARADSALRGDRGGAGNGDGGPVVGVGTGAAAPPATPRALTSRRARRHFARCHRAFSEALAAREAARRAEWVAELQREAEAEGRRAPVEEELEAGVPDEWEHDSDDGFVVVPVAPDDFLPMHESALATWKAQRALALEGRAARRARRRARRTRRRARRRERRLRRLREMWARRSGGGGAGGGVDAGADTDVVERLYAAQYGSDTAAEEAAEEAAAAAPSTGRDAMGRLMSAAERADISEGASSREDSDSPSGSSCLEASGTEEEEADGEGADVSGGAGGGKSVSPSVRGAAIARREALAAVRGARGPRGFAWESAASVLGPHPLAAGDGPCDLVAAEEGLRRRRARRRRPRRAFCGPRRSAVFDTLSLPVVYERNKTGFEEEKDMVPRAGTVIAGRYRVVGFLGEAAFSTAVECEDLTGRGPERVCLKIIQNNKEYTDQSLDEIKLLKYINACGDADEFRVLRLLDYFYHREHLILVSELLRDNLYEYGRFNREQEAVPYFTPERVRRIAFQCLRALAFLHDVNLVHCDLKPENVVIQSYSRAQVKIIDFGSSCFLTDHLTSYIQSRSYRAPEVILGLPYGQKIDIWSLGCILAELITGHVLFQNDSVATMLARAQGILGPIPRRMLREGSEVPKYFTAEFTAFEASEETGEISLVYPKRTTLAHRLRTSDPLLLDFLLFLLQWDPKARPTAREALHHPWLATELAAFLRTSPDGLSQRRAQGPRGDPHLSPPAATRGGRGGATARPLSPSPRGVSEPSMPHDGDDASYDGSETRGDSQASP